MTRQGSRRGWRRLVGSVLAGVGLGIAGLLFAAAAPAEKGREDLQALATAAEAIGSGRFETARGLLREGGLRTSEDAVRARVQALLDECDGWRVQNRAEHLAAYDETVGKLNEAVQTARWRDELLRSSRQFALASKEKEAEETRLAEQAREQWLTALADLRLAADSARRMEIEPNVPATLRQEVIEQALQGARELEREGKWMEAYVQAYRHLEQLDEQNKAYQQTGERLVRQVVLTELYAPDPNQQGTPWQQRQAGASGKVFGEGLQRVVERYVEPVDFREMARKGLRNCLLVGQTPRLEQAFPGLADGAKRQRYCTALEQLLAAAEAAPASRLNYQYLSSLLKEVQQISTETVGLPGEAVIAEYADGVFGALDGYTYIVWPGEVKSFRKDMTGEFPGIGVEIGREEGRLRVNSLLEGSPAEQAGVDAGDVITAIDGQPTATMSLTTAVDRITGPAGTSVVLTVNRAGLAQPRDLTVTRGKIVVHTVKGLYRNGEGGWEYLLDRERKIAYVRLTNFYEETTDSLRQVLQQALRNGLGGLILDLRDNSGGFLSTAVEVADLFLPSGVIVSTAGRDGQKASYDWARPEGTLDAALPLAVLVNGGSASASEIVAGALKDHGRAVIVGARTFGKGNVQVIQPLRPSEAELKMTVAYYYLPSGRRVHRNLKDRTKEDYGVEPDVKVELGGKQVERLAETRRQATILHRSNGEPQPKPSWKVYTPDELRESDPQLTMAWLCLRGELLAQGLKPKGPAEREFVGPAAR